MNFELSDREYEIVEYILSCRGACYIDVVNHFDPVNRCTETDDLLKHLLSLGLLHSSATGYQWDTGFLTVTPAGRSALLVHRERTAAIGLQLTEDRSADDKNQSKNHVQKTLQVIKSVVSRFWAVVCAFSVIVTILGWPLLKRLFSFLGYFFH